MEVQTVELFRNGAHGWSLVFLFGWFWLDWLDGAVLEAVSLFDDWNDAAAAAGVGWLEDEFWVVGFSESMLHF